MKTEFDNQYEIFQALLELKQEFSLKMDRFATKYEYSIEPEAMAAIGEFEDQLNDAFDTIEQGARDGDESTGDSKVWEDYDGV
jgi:hypothetical protein